jgi:glycosyltransferase involved in cell wall biosynthesis
MPVVTNGGHLTEQLWRDSNAVSLCTEETLVQGVEQLLADRTRRRRLGIHARQFYIENFDVQRTIAALKTLSSGKS